MKIDPAQLEATIREVLAAMLPGNDNQTEATGCSPTWIPRWRPPTWRSAST